MTIDISEQCQRCCHTFGEHQLNPSQAYECSRCECPNFVRSR